MKTVIFILTFVFGVIANSFSQKNLDWNNLSEATTENFVVDNSAGYATVQSTYDIKDTLNVSFLDSIEYKIKEGLDNIGSDISGMKIFTIEGWNSGDWSKWDNVGDYFLELSNPDTIKITTENGFLNNTTYIVMVRFGVKLYTFQLTVGIDPNASISTIDESITIKAYPNPTIDYVTVNFESNSDVELAVYNLSGVIVYYKDVKYIGSQSIKINMSDFISGMYFLQVGNERIKLMKE